MPTLDLGIQPAPPTAAPITPARVYVDGRRRHDLAVLRWEVLGPPEFGRIVLTPTPRDETKTLPRIEHTAALPSVGAAVRAVAPDDAGAAEMRAVVTEHALDLADDAERLTAVALHELAAVVRPPVTGHWRRMDDGAVAFAPGRLRFNGSPDGLAAPRPVELNGRTTRVFSADEDAVAWTIPDVLAYLLAAHLPADVERQGLAELADIAPAVALEPTDLTGLSLADALGRIAGEAGLELRSARDGLGLVLYRAGVNGRTRRVGLQMPGAALDTERTNLWRGRMRFRRRPSRPGVLALGAPKLYESTFVLHPGWDPARGTARWRDVVRGFSGDWPTNAPVYRKWVLNEHGQYESDPWNLAVEDFSSISPADFTLRVPRRFLPCLSADRNGQSLGYVVEFRTSPTGDWRRWTGPLWVSESECAVYLGGDALPGEYFQAAASGDAGVRITATVAADARLQAELDGDPGAGRRVLDVASRAGWASVHATSIFHGADGLGPPAVADDAAQLAEIAGCAADAPLDAAEAELQLGWVDTTFHVGDIVEQVDGRAIGLSTRPGAAACVRTVRHDFDETHTTTLILKG